MVESYRGSVTNLCQCLIAACILLLGFFSAHSSATVYDNYAIYKGDVDADGDTDLYFHSRPIFILVGIEHRIPFYIDGPPAYALLYDPVARQYSAPSALTLTEADITAKGLMAAVASTDYHILPDVDNNGRADILIQGDGEALNSLVLLSTYNQLPGVAMFPADGVLTLAGAVLKIADFNNDAYLDFYIDRLGNHTVSEYVAWGNSGGQFNTLAAAPAINTPSPLMGGPAAFAQPAHDAAVGALASKYEVSSDGNASYSIPVSIPAGLGGVQPQLTLTYSSGGSEGMLGLGWGLSGLSVIHRCATTLERDGYLDGVDFDSNDKFCLDGQRLVSVGTNEYRTENDSQTQIIASGSIGPSGAPASFEVRARDGKIFHYGTSADSQIQAHGRTDIYIWALHKARDRYSNELTVTYEKETAHTEYRPLRIDYSANSTPGAEVGPYNSVRFEYIARTQVKSHYGSGSAMAATKLLKRIKTFAGNTELRNLELAYTFNTATYQHQMTSVTQCAGSQCLPATTFTWETGPVGFNTPTQWLSAAQTGGEPVFSGRGKRQSSIDINGDGLGDWVWVPDGTTALWMALSTGSGFTTPDEVLTTVQIGTETVHPYSGDNGAYTAFVDVNGDGRDDMIWVPFGLTSVWVALSNGTGFATPTKWLAGNATRPVYSSNGQYGSYADLNGDGLMDKVWVPSGRKDLWVALSDGTKFGTPELWLAENTAQGSDPYSGDGGAYTRYTDMNGDGLTDLVWVPYSRVDVWVALSDGTEFTAPQKWLSDTSNGANVLPFSADGMHESYVDLNGDGLPEKVWVPKNLFGLWVSENTGTDLLPPTEWLPVTNGINPFSGSGKHDSYIDINGDGLLDKVWVPSGRIDLWVSLSTGLTFDTPEILLNSIVAGGVAAPYSKNGAYEQYGDVNGDGAPDKVWIAADGVELYVATAKPPTGKLKTATNGFGNTVEFYYLPMTDSSVYTPAPININSYPVQDIHAAGFVVSKVTTSNALGGVFTQRFHYEGLKSHATGLGSLGFSKITTFNDDTSIDTLEYYSQDHNARTHGNLTQVQTRAPNGTIISDTNNTWTTVTHGTGENKYYWRNLTQTVVEKKDLNGAFLHKEVNDYTYETSYNTVATITSKVYDSPSTAGTPLRVTTTTNSNFTHNASSWLIGLIGRVTVDTQVTGQLLAQKISTWEFDATTGRILKEKIHNPANDAVLHETRHENIDSYGRALRTVVAGPDFATRQSIKAADSSQRYIATVTNDLLHSATSTYYPDTHINAGLLQTTTDSNNITTHYQYDAFGRQTVVTTAWGSANPVSGYTSYQNCSALGNDCPANAQYRITRSSDGGAGSYEYLDNLGRKLRTSHQLMDGSFTITDYTFNNKGYNTRVTEPYLQGASATHWTDISHDDLGRATTMTGPDGSINTIAYNGLIRTLVNDSGGKNQQKTEARNVLGNLVSVQDNQSNTTSYTYDSLANMTSVTDSAGNSTTITYDALGRKTAMDDNDKGYWQYTYNGLGQLISQTNARQETTCMAYDTLSRMTRRIDNYQGSVNRTLGGSGDAKNQCANDVSNLQTVQWIYDTAPGNATGKLHQVLAPDSYRETYEYDSYGRQDYFIQSANGEQFAIDTSYDAYHRLQTTTYPGASNRLSINNVYNNLGFTVELTNAANGMPYYQATAVDARGNITGSTLGNGISVVREHQADTGRIKNIRSYSYFDSTATPTIQDLSVTFDAVGNLTARNDALQTIDETFGYDTLNRLTTTSADFGNGDIRSTSVSYDALGNISSKTGVGNYSYGGTCGTQTAGPHAVSSITGTKNASYCYDANGNMISGDGRAISYSHFDKPTLITKGAYTSILKYNAARSLYYREDQSAAGTIKTTFVGGLYEKVVLPTNATEERHYVGGFGIITFKDRTASSAGTTQERYLHKDHLGSTTLITDEYGQIVEQFSFDPWGKRRAPNLQALIAELGSWNTLSVLEKNNLTIDAALLSSSITNRGFTGHEQLDGVGLIHMGGRVYDAEIGRFISADPFVQDRTYSQSLNRYTYVWNNPLSFTDPTGYFVAALAHLEKKVSTPKNLLMRHVRAFQKRRKSEGKFLNKNPALQAVATVVVTYFCWGVCAGPWVAIMSAVNAGVSASRTYAAGGSSGNIIKGLAIAGVSSYIGINYILQIQSTMGQVVGSMVLAGVSSKASGGQFIDGVKGVAAGMLINGLINAAAKAYKSWMNRQNYQGPQGFIKTPELESSAMDNVLGESTSLPDVTADNGPGDALPPETVEPIPDVEVVDPGYPVNYSSTSPTSAPTENILDTAKTGTEYTQADIELGVEKVIDYGNKITPWVYGKGLQISGGIVKGAGIYTKRLGVENLGDGMMKVGEIITPKDYAITLKR